MYMFVISGLTFFKNKKNQTTVIINDDDKKERKKKEKKKLKERNRYLWGGYRRVFIFISLCWI